MSDHTDSKMRELTYKLIAMAPEAPPFPEEAMVQLEPTRTTTSRAARGRPFAWAAAAAVAVIVLVAAPLILLNLGDDPDPTPPATTVTVPDVTSTTIPDATTPQATVFPGRDAILLSGTGLGVVDLGADVETTIAVVSSVFGAPTQDTGWVDGASSNCPGTEIRDVSWNSLFLAFTDASDEYAPDGGRHFFQYAYGSSNPASAGIPAEPSGLATAEDITLGSTVADLKVAYGSDLELWDASATGPGWAAAGGAVTGSLTGVADGDTVLSIEGGHVCPE